MPNKGVNTCYGVYVIQVKYKIAVLPILMWAIFGVKFFLLNETGEILLMYLLSGIYFTLKKIIGVMMQLYFIPGLNLKVNWLPENTY